MAEVHLEQGADDGKYGELSEEVVGLEEEWKIYKEAFVGAAEELYRRTSQMGVMV